MYCKKKKLINDCLENWEDKREIIKEQEVNICMGDR